MATSLSQRTLDWTRNTLSRFCDLSSDFHLVKMYCADVTILFHHISHQVNVKKINKKLSYLIFAERFKFVETGNPDLNLLM